MIIEPIRTEADYKSAMARIDGLWGSEPGSPEGDELDVLIALTGVYEKKHYPIAPPDALSLLEYRLDQLGLSEKEIERVMEFRKRIPEIMSKEGGLSPEVIHSFKDIPFEAFLVPAD
ncbi:MAG: transcriptional regulator [Pseudomonadota bacterium]